MQEKLKKYTPEELSELTNDELLDLKKKKEKEFYDFGNIDKSSKSMLVGFYGALTLGHNQYSAGRISGAQVTISGRHSNKMCSLAANNMIQRMLGEEETTDLVYIIQVDTDSFYLNVGALFKHPKLSKLTSEERIRFIIKLSNGKLQEVITATIEKICHSLNVRDTESLVMENEVITDGFVSVASKRYFTRVVVNDGNILETPKIKVVGLSLISKSTPDLLKKKLKPVLKYMLDEDVNYLQNYIENIRGEFDVINPTEYARKVTVNDLDHYWTGTAWKRKKENKELTASIGAWAALEYNRYVRENDLEGKYPLIEQGESVNYIYVSEPNALGIKKAIAWKDPRFADELNLHKCVNMDEHFNKDFVRKIEIITEKIGYDINKKTEALTVW